MCLQRQTGMTAAVMRLKNDALLDCVCRRKEIMNNTIELFLAFAKIGVFTFGGVCGASQLIFQLSYD